MNKESILGLVRHLLTFGGGLVVGQGWLDDATANTVVASVITLVGAVWSVLDKRKG